MRRGITGITIQRPDKIRFGGLLVIQIVAFRQAISFRGFTEKLKVNERLITTIEKIPAAGPGSTGRQLCNAADTILSELLKLISEMTPDESREVLLPLFLNEKRLNWNNNGRTSELLELLCNMDSFPYLEARRFCHDLMNVTSSIGGGLLELTRLCSGRRRLSPRLAEVTGRVVRVCYNVTEFLRRGTDELDRAGAALFKAYYGTEEHREAVRILQAKLDEIIASDPANNRWLSEELNSGFGQFERIEEPHVTLWMTF